MGMPMLLSGPAARPASAMSLSSSHAVERRSTLAVKVVKVAFVSMLLSVLVPLRRHMSRRCRPQRRGSRRRGEKRRSKDKE